jgi:hypothetical protein
MVLIIHTVYKKVKERKVKVLEKPPGPAGGDIIVPYCKIFLKSTVQ